MSSPFRLTRLRLAIASTVLAASASSHAFTLQLLHAADQEAQAAAVGDAPRFSAVLEALRSEPGVADSTLTLSSGDAIIPGLFYSASEAVFGAKGIADIEIQNELGFHAISFGNHEFDDGTANIAGLISGAAADPAKSPGFTGTDFPFLSTNLDFSTDANMALLESVQSGSDGPQPNIVTSSTVIAQDGQTFGIVGATTPTLASISSPGDIGISPAPFDAIPTPAQLDALAGVIQAEVDFLLANNSGMNKVILLAHMQRLDIELGLAERMSNVDIIVAGGSNTRLFDSNDRARAGDSVQGVYPQFVTDADSKPVAVVNTDGSYKYVGRLVIEFDAQGNIIPSSYDADVSGAYATDEQGVADLNAGGLIDPEIQSIADAIGAQILATESNVFGIANVFLNGNRSGTGAADDPDGVRTQETNLGNLTADANLAEARAFDTTVMASLKNGGGIRASIGQIVVPPGGTEAERLPNESVVDTIGNVIKPEGGISQNDIQSTLAFNNGLTLLTVTREELLALLEHGVSAVPRVAGQFPQVAGVHFTYEPGLPAGNRILSAAFVDTDGNVKDRLVEHGKLVGDPEGLVRIVTLGFLANSRFDDDGNFTGGGDDFPFPNQNLTDFSKELGDPGVVARLNRVDLEQEGVKSGDAQFADDGTEQDALAEYLDDNFRSVAFDEVDVGPEGDQRIKPVEFQPILTPLGTYETGRFDETAQEIPAYDPKTQRLFVTNGDAGTVEILDILDPTKPEKVGEIDLDALFAVSSKGIEVGPNSVAFDGVLAVAVERAIGDRQQPGLVAFFDADGQLLDSVEVGFLPDMVTFTPNGRYVLAANEGEPSDDYSYDPEGSISIIRINSCKKPVYVKPGYWGGYKGRDDDRRGCKFEVKQRDVKTAGFERFNRFKRFLQHRGVRIFGPGATVAQDLEPEHIAISDDSKLAYVTLQENNALAVVSIPFGKVLRVLPLGLKDWIAGDGLDASDRDDAINIQAWPVKGMYQPDAIASFTIDKHTYLVTANEGDARDYDTFSEEERVKDLTLDPVAFPDAAELQVDEALGRLEVTNATGDLDGDGDFDQIHAYGARSFTIWKTDKFASVEQVYDSGSQLEQITAARLPNDFNSDNDENDSFDTRSDAKGPEPEGVTVGKIDGRTYVFVGLERVSGIMMYDVTDPEHPVFVQYVNNRDFSGDPEAGTAGDLGPEGLLFIAAEDSPNGEPLLVVTNEVSGTTTVYSVTP